ncbi:class I SAM-dependent methyltransferase [Amycolatopsis magusensis]|uniref:class I SAM-dependent methyltransferase n=1 Tax=Amycolatopsis magusensis TaxID=882444 RepID=UPI0024A80DCA|nr:class I SAM-dependent methyltransferase [Amycolatopsis magusensis]MDI5974580.1 class I SAM-dependent methyltransferase [Amycolatopsis magusensis]
MTDKTTVDEATRFWNEHYRTKRPSGRVNPVLAELAGSLPPGVALDLGCGGGADALWLAARGWRVTAADISATAVRALRERAEAEHAQVTAVQVDLAADFPSGTFDLISAHYLHTPFDLPRAAVLRTAANALRPGGRLMVVDHGSAAPWSWNQDPDAHFATPTEVAAELDLDPREWSVERADQPRRRATGPGGQTATVTDHVLVVRRGPEARG